MEPNAIQTPALARIKYKCILRRICGYYESNDSINFKSQLKRLLLYKLSRSQQILAIDEETRKLTSNMSWFTRTQQQLLSKIKGVLEGKSYYLFSVMSHAQTHASLDDINRTRLDNLNSVTNNGTSDSTTNNPITKPSILTILVSNDSNGIERTWYYGGAVPSLEEFTPSMFIRASHQYNFFRFCRNPSDPNVVSWWSDPLNDDAWFLQDVVPGYNQLLLKNTDCSDEEVNDIMEYNKTSKKERTLFLLMFFMSSYYKNMIYEAIQSTIRYISDVDHDVLSVIMDYLLSHHINIRHVFETEFVKLLMLEASYASADWQDLLVDILQKDTELMQMYEPRIRIYHESESLNLLNMELNSKTNFDRKCTGYKWLNETMAKY
eukprot:165629_1